MAPGPAQVERKLAEWLKLVWKITIGDADISMLLRGLRPGHRQCHGICHRLGSAIP